VFINSSVLNSLSLALKAIFKYTLMTTDQNLPTFADVSQAAKRLNGFAHRTPVLRSTFADEMFGAEVFFKCENFQRMGAFKFRGGFNALAKFTPEQRRLGVVAFSSGNHAQAIALAARILAMPAVIVMPQDVPALKIAATRGYGAEVVLYDRYQEDREAIGLRLAAERGLTLIPPFDHADVISGQGTAAQELIEEVGSLDAFFTCLGGGGLLAGSCLAIKALSPSCRIYGVEPEAGNDVQQSFRSGQPVKIDVPKTIADGAQTQLVGKLTFPIIQRDVADVLTATDTQLIQAMHFFAERMKMMVEPTGALGFAAARFAAERGELNLKGRRIGILISGGNVDVHSFARLMLEMN
jgi:threo-3-hydroxy-L-aspartate ammonia-lyase